MAALALDITETRIGGFNFSDLSPGVSSPSSSAANGAAYPVRPAYVYDLASGSILYEEFHPYGTSAYRAVDSSIAVSAKRYRYTGKERDEETGLDHMGLRYYAPGLGRWTSSDPIGLGDGVNRFAYVSGNPVGMRDPSGTFGVLGDRPIGEQVRQAAIQMGKKADPKPARRQQPIELVKKAQAALSQIARTRTSVSEEDLFREQVRQEAAANETTIKNNEGFWEKGSPLLTGIGEGVPQAGAVGTAVVLAPIATAAAGLGYFLGSGAAEETAGAVGRVASGTETPEDERLIGNLLGGIAAFGLMAQPAAPRATPKGGGGSSRRLTHFTDEAGAQGIEKAGGIKASDPEKMFSVNKQGKHDAGMGRLDRSETPNVFLTTITPEEMTPELAAELGIEGRTSHAFEVSEAMMQAEGLPVFDNPSLEHTVNVVVDFLESRFFVD